jgi:hypothetical protein
MGGGGRGHVAEAKMRYPSHQVTKFNQKSLCDISSAKWLSTKNRSTRRSTPSHPIAMASTAKPPDPMPCALAAILLPESRAHGCHMQKTLFPGTYWVHAGEAVPGAAGGRRTLVGSPFRMLHKMCRGGRTRRR